MTRKVFLFFFCDLNFSHLFYILFTHTNLLKLLILAVCRTHTDEPKNGFAQGSLWIRGISQEGLWICFLHACCFPVQSVFLQTSGRILSWTRLRHKARGEKKPSRFFPFQLCRPCRAPIKKCSQASQADKFLQRWCFLLNFPRFKNGMLAQNSSTR